MIAQSLSHSVCLGGGTGTCHPLPVNTSLPTCSATGGAHVPHLTLLSAAFLFVQRADTHWRRPRVRARETGEFRVLACVQCMGQKRNAALQNTAYLCAACMAQRLRQCYQWVTWFVLRCGKGSIRSIMLNYCLARPKMGRNTPPAASPRPPGIVQPHTHPRRKILPPYPPLFYNHVNRRKSWQDDRNARRPSRRSTAAAA